MHLPKVLFVAPRFHTNHVGWVGDLKRNGWVIEAVVGLVNRGEVHDSVEVTTFPQSIISKVLSKINFFKGANKPNHGPGLLWVIRYLRSRRPNAVIIRGRGSYSSLLFTIACRVIRIPAAIYDQEDLYSNQVTSRLKRAFDWLFYAKGMTPICGFGSIRRSRKWKLVPFLAVESGKTGGERSGRKRFVSIGKYESERKRIDLLLLAFSRYMSDEYALRIIGTSSTGEVPQAFRELVEQLGMSNVAFDVNLSHQEVLKVLARSDVFVLPARDEPASVALVEALEAGLFVICSDTCGTKDYVPPGAGIVFVTDEISSLGEALLLATGDGAIQPGPEEVLFWRRRDSEVMSISDFVASLAFPKREKLDHGPR